MKVIGTLRSLQNLSFGPTASDAGLEELAGLTNLEVLRLHVDEQVHGSGFALDTRCLERCARGL